VDVFAMHYELHYQQKKIRLRGSENKLATQFRCITFHPSRYGVERNWLHGRNWFYCKVPSQKLDLHGKGMYPLSSEMRGLEYLMDTSYACGADDVSVMAFAEAATIIGGHDAVEEFLACGISLEVDESCPRCTRIHYVTRKSTRMQKHKFGMTCPVTLFVGSALDPPEHEK
jgi:hypothetical protein